jgi:hypothetical protein
MRRWDETSYAMNLAGLPQTENFIEKMVKATTPTHHLYYIIDVCVLFA